jgi:hypothetical protein
MIELVFVICLSAAPVECRTERLLFQDVSLMTCMMGAPAQLALWSQRRPDWAIQRWSCAVQDLSRAEL